MSDKSGFYTHPNGYREPVKIRRAARDHTCEHCGARIPQGSLHGVGYIALPIHLCFVCVEVEPADE